MNTPPLTRAVACARITGIAVCLLVLAGCGSTPAADPSDSSTALFDTADATETSAALSHPSAAPEGLSVAENGLRSAAISWSPPSRPVAGYRVERSESPDGPFEPIATVPPQLGRYTDGEVKRLKDNTTYYYRLTAVLDKAGTPGASSAVARSTTAPPPAPPQNLLAKPSASRAVTLTWTPSESEGVTAYRIERAPQSTPDAFELAGTARTPPFTDGGTPATTLRDSTAYRYRVFAVNRVESESSPSPAAEVVTLPPPTPVRNPVARSQEVRCVPLSWEAHEAEDIVRYDVYQSRAETGPFAIVGSVSGRLTTRFTDGGANPGNLEDEGAYYYRLRAVNAVGAESGDSQTLHAITRGVPVEVTQVRAVSDRPREVPLSWTASADESVVGYEVWRAEAECEEWTQIVRLNSRTAASHTDRGTVKDGTKLGDLKDGTEYQYKIIAFNTANIRSSASDPVTARTKHRPAAPADLSATADLACSVKLKWRTNPEPDVNAYLVEASGRPTSGFRRLTVARAAEGEAQTALEVELEPNTVRHYRVKALDKEGLESDWSAVAEGRSKPVPDAPTALRAQGEEGRIRLVWDPPPQPDVVSYNVWSKRLLGWNLIGTTDRTDYLFDAADVSKKLTVAVTAIDNDKLESTKSAPIPVQAGNS